MRTAQSARAPLAPSQAALESQALNTTAFITHHSNELDFTPNEYAYFTNMRFHLFTDFGFLKTMKRITMLTSSEGFFLIIQTHPDDASSFSA